MKKISNMLWGLVFIVVGLILGLNALEITKIDIFFDGWWTLFIIVPCFIDLFKDDYKTGNVIGLIIGILLLLACQDILKFEIVWKLMLPVILVVIGLSFIFKDALNNKIRQEIAKIGKKSDKEYCSTFGGQTVDFSNEEFNGCELTAVFGGVKCDLNNAIIKEDCVIDVSAIFGGVTIYVPDNVNVKVTSTPIFGGVSNSRKREYKESDVTVYINAKCVFGGVEIK